jgi:hypothetical protein
MPTIRKRNGKWQVQVRLKGHAAIVETFPDGTKKEQAREWGLEQERKLKLRDVPTLQKRALGSMTLEGLIRRFLKES